MALIEFQHPFFRPIWRRYVLVAVCFGWTVLEFVTGSPLWGILFAAIGVAAIWQLFFTPWPGENDKEP